ncbi:hypothetical protein DFH28DRAFT_1080298 [Melampsora americana]|nr:hypothetical protein DFH28DRAFT_1080298 [Melampsora americana]
MLGFFSLYLILYFLITLRLLMKLVDAKPMHSMRDAHKQTHNYLETRASEATTLHATGHYLGKKPSSNWISSNPAGKSNDDIQAAECAYNLRLQDQIFAYFKIDPSKAQDHGAPYGTCYAINAAPEESDLEVDTGYDVFFWNYLGGESGVGTGPIRNPETGEAGYEDRNGVYHDGENPDKTP